MRRLIAIVFIGGAALAGTVACSGQASADDQVVIVNQSSSSSSASSSCVPADVLARFPWLPAPACP